jgi:hypothetical protein
MQYYLNIKVDFRLPSKPFYLANFKTTRLLLSSLTLNAKHLIVALEKYLFTLILL